MKKLKFFELDLSPQIKKAIAEMGFEEATPIQSLVIPLILDGEDVTGQAQTGTGKTAAFGIPILEMIDTDNKKLQAVIICPTRELAIQVAEEFRRLSKYMKKIRVLPIYGGQPIERQFKALQKGVQIIIGTPGRVMDHMRRGTLQMSNVSTIVLDEADEMLDMGFREDIEYILEYMPRKRQTLLFSATMPPSILNLTKNFQKTPKFIKVVHQEMTVPEIEQIYFEVKEKMKLELLSRLIDIYNPKLSLVFCNTKRRVDTLVTHLQVRGYLADGLHGDMTQNQRDRVMGKFRKGQIEILIATDVAARGIDVDDIEAVFNYDVPNDDEYYVHRIGRTARAGRTGQAFTFVSGREIYQLRDIQKFTKTKIEQHKIPSLADVEEIKTDMFLEALKSVINNEDLDKYIHIVERLMEEDYTSVETAAALLKIVMNKENNAETSNFEFKDTGAGHGMVRFFINAGRKQNIKAKDIIKAVDENTGLSSHVVGKIDVFDRFSFIEVPVDSAQNFLSLMNKRMIKGKRVNVEPANKKNN